MGFAQAGVDPFPSVVSLQRGRPLLLFQGGEKLRLLPGSQQVLMELAFQRSNHVDGNLQGAERALHPL